jgi:hypothetical protein
MMGLFNLGKKRDIPLPPKPAASELGLQQPEPLPANEVKEEIDFTEFSDEMPTPPSDSPFTQTQFAKPVSLGAKPQAGVEIRELPSIEMPAQAKTGQESSGPRDKVIYELPDFLDEETKTLLQAKQAEQKKELAKKQEPVKPPTAPPVQTKPKTYPALEKIEINPEPIKPKALVEAYNESISYAEKLKPSAPVLKEPFMDINKYFDLKDDFETIRKLISTTQDKLEHEAMLSKEKSDRYQAVAETINYLQEKLMLMDTKLFES